MILIYMEGKFIDLSDLVWDWHLLIPRKLVFHNFGQIWGGVRPVVEFFFNEDFPKLIF